MSTASKVSSASPVKAMSQAAIYGERAMAMMNSLRVLPTPQNYSVFFTCAAGQPSGIIKAIDKRVADKEPFTEEFLEKLYNTYIAAPQALVMQDTAANAKRVLSDIMQNVNAFAGQTNALSQEVSQQLQSLDDGASEDVVRMLATRLMQGAESMQSSSETMTARLAGAQQEIADLRENLARAMTEAERDFLTGTFNRKAFDKRLNEALLAAKTEEFELTLLMIDIDHFKHFNDNFGHLIGDEVLKIVAKTLTDTLKGMDCVARFGGEEFAVILPRTPITGGMVVAEAIRKSIASKELKRKTTGENFGVITVSIGVSAFRPASDSSSSLIGRADEALYVAKGAGRNRAMLEVVRAS
ncbi:MAG: GGDEF domain-containing protein [Rickettsiales bacterium]